MGRHSRNSIQKRVLKERLLCGKKQTKCCFCKRVMGLSNLTIEHIIPIVKGGSWHISNLKLSCNSCNQDRGDMEYNLYKLKGKTNGNC